MCNTRGGTKGKLNPMIFPFGVQSHADQRLRVWRPRGLLNENRRLESSGLIIADDTRSSLV